ncbi:UNVERIFIED_CONTAM: hypothetical protein PYX00_000891 [Menopon gallinae]|uniref:Uncharacterized protein n=1 Tax=Menopon gallinae TaxID=328185 RepID=A0AAW2IBY4_9NEOP
MGEKIGRRMKKLYEQVVFERRVLLVCTVIMFFAIVLWLVAIATEYWFIVDGGDGIYLPKTKRYFLSSHAGVWRTCRYTFVNATGIGQKHKSHNGTDVPVRKAVRSYFDTNCTAPDMGKKKKDPTFDINVMNYSQAEAVFSVITVILMVLGFVFSSYTFKNPRYMFKRTAGALHFLSAGASFTVIEVVMHTVDYQRKHVPYMYPPGSTHSFGFSFALAWLVFISNLIAGLAFMIFSRKRKGKKAPTEELGMADEPAIIGR